MHRRISRELSWAMLLALLSFVSSAQAAPVVIIASFETATWSAANPCPFPAGDPVFVCSQPAQKLNIVGSLFGAGGVGSAAQIGGALPSPLPLPLVPDDIPDALTLAALTSGIGASGGCVAASLYTGDDNSYRICPYQRVDLLDPRANLSYVADLGRYAGVTRSISPANGNCSAITGQLFYAGGMCNGSPRTTQVTFTCIDTTAPDVDYYTRSPQVFAAESTDGGCSYALDLPIVAACDGLRYGLCSAESPGPTPGPNPLPSVSPQFTMTSAFVGAWSDTLVTAYAMGTSPPQSIQVATPAGISQQFAPVPAPLEPSRSPVPVPFPPTLQVLGLVPNSAPAAGGTEIVVMLAGVTGADLLGDDAGFDLAWPTAPGPGAATVTKRLQGSPSSVDGRAPAPPANGLLNLTMAARAMGAGGWAGPVVLSVQSRQWNSTAWAVIRSAACAPGACGFTYATGSASPAPAPSGKSPVVISTGAAVGIGVGAVAAVGVMVAATLFVMRSARPLPQTDGIFSGGGGGGGADVPLAAAEPGGGGKVDGLETRAARVAAASSLNSTNAAVVRNPLGAAASAGGGLLPGEA